VMLGLAPLLRLAVGEAVGLAVRLSVLLGVPELLEVALPV
jgi:hypothetical protein